MLYDPNYLLKEAKRQSANAWNIYLDYLDSCDDRKLNMARENYIREHNKVAAISREIRKRDRTTKKTISKTAAGK